MKFTVQSLIDELSKFPTNLEIITELSFMWNFPEEIREEYDGDINSKDFAEYSKSQANELLIFEGSWEKDNISDVDNILEEYLQVRD